MEIRDALQRHRGITATVGILILAAAAGMIFLQLHPDHAFDRSAEKMFLTVDDGKSFIVDEVHQPPPVTVNGKTAYRAYVFTPDGGKTKFVGYIERFTPAGKKLLEQHKQTRTKSDHPDFVPGLAAETEIKRPGDPTWVRQSDLAHAAPIMEVKCPGDPTRSADLVHE